MYIHTYMYMCTEACIHTYKAPHVDLQLCVYTYICVCVCMYVCIHVYSYVCMYVCMYTSRPFFPLSPCQSGVEHTVKQVMSSPHLWRVVLAFIHSILDLDGNLRSGYPVRQLENVFWLAKSFTRDRLPHIMSHISKVKTPCKWLIKNESAGTQHERTVRILREVVFDTLTFVKELRIYPHTPTPPLTLT